MSEPTSIVLHADGLPEARPSPALGDDRPKEILGQPVLYAWKPMLKTGEYVHPQHGWTLRVTPDRLNGLHANTKKLLGNGYKPFVPEKHKGYDAKNNFGWVIETKVEDGTLWGLHQLIGDDAHKAAARNDSSVCIKKNYRDGKGAVYDEVIEHNALCPDPVAGGLGGFIALSASANGSPQDVAPVYTLAAHRSDTAMALSPEQLEKVRKLPGAADVTEDNAVDKLIELATPREGEVKMSREDKDKLDRELTAARNRVTELSRQSDPPKAPDPEVLRERSLRLSREIDGLLDGADNTDFALKLKAKLLGNTSAPNAFMLSRDGDADDCRAADFIALMREYKPVKLGQQTRGQADTLSLSHDAPGGGDKEKAELDRIRAEAKAYAEQMNGPRK